MASLYMVALTLLAAAASASPSRIIGGNPSTVETYPSIVQVESLNFGLFWSHSCAGTILNSVNILTAAHCFTGPDFSEENRRIRAGATYLETGGVIVHIAKAYNHPSFGQNGNNGDISVARLSSAFIFSNTIAAGSIIASGFTMPGGMLVTKAGWGVTEVDGEKAEQLQAVSVLTIDRLSCAMAYALLPNSPNVTENMFCAGSPTADACYGDGGGPVFFGNILVGIVSWGNGCLQSGYPGVNTAVAPYTNWIMEVTSA